jgi:chitodextrinase
VTAGATGPTGVDVAWVPSTDDVGVNEYRVLRDGAQIASVTGTSFSDVTVSPSTTYSYAVQAADAAGNVSPASAAAIAATPALPPPPAPADETAPTTPTGLTASPTSTSVALSWTASTDAVGVQQYVVYRDGVAVGTSSTPSYLDSARTPYSSYTYAVEAVDAAGNISTRSQPLTVLTPAASGQILTFAPTDDAYVSGASGATATNFGAASVLQVRSSPAYAALLRFVVDTHACAVSSARLTLLATDGSTKGGDVYRAASTTWSQSTVTWATAPATSGSKLATLGKVVAGKSYTATVTPAVARDGAVAFRLVGSSTDVAGYAAKESGSSRAAKLAVTCA